MRSDYSAPISRNSNPLMPGSWEPGRFHLSDALIIKVTLIAMALWRGIDYFTPQVAGPTPVSESMASAFPLEVWAVFVIVSGLILAFGLVTRMHFAVWLGHGLLAAFYATLFVSLLVVYVQRPLWDGIRSSTVILAPLVLHTLLSIRTGWRPPRWGLGRDADE